MWPTKAISLQQSNAISFRYTGSPHRQSHPILVALIPGSCSPRLNQSRPIWCMWCTMVMMLTSVPRITCFYNFSRSPASCLSLLLLLLLLSLIVDFCIASLSFLRCSEGVCLSFPADLWFASDHSQQCHIHSLIDILLSLI